MDALTQWLGGMNWGAIVVVLLGSSAVSALVSHMLTQRGTDAQARREGYGCASRVLVRRAEYPYRVRRRVNNDPAVVTGLVELGHSLQEDLATSRLWVKSESHWLGDEFELALGSIDTCVGDATSEAWEAEPITNAAGMRLGTWGPGDCTGAVGRFEAAAAWRFGWRRLVPAFIARRNL